MALIDDYADDPSRAFSDALIDPVFSTFFKEPYIEYRIATGERDGVQFQYQVQALSSKGARDAVKRIIARFQELGVNLKDWVCSPEEFNFCEVMRSHAAGVGLRKLYAFLENKWVQAGTMTLSVITSFATLVVAAALGNLLALLAAIGWATGEFIEMCGCNA